VEGRGPVTRVLLDTHVWIWALQQPERLNAKAHKLLDHPANELYLSPVSIWEASHLAQRHRIRIRGTFEEWLKLAFSKAPLREAPFNFAVATEAARLQLPQADIGDVLLAATASVFGLVLLTADDQLLSHAPIKTLPAGR
jgi:PIN domain nuclease of toxin-antitoxin system